MKNYLRSAAMMLVLIIPLIGLAFYLYGTRLMTEQQLCLASIEINAVKLDAVVKDAARSDATPEQRSSKLNDALQFSAALQQEITRCRK
jgi:hypothetical protein